MFHRSTLLRLLLAVLTDFLGFLSGVSYTPVKIMPGNQKSARIHFLPGISGFLPGK